MTSLIEGYEYDIFISYRQKDNKHDGWVTEFVNNLKGELESTFKEEVSVYFDINPHDGLLETHDVDESLKEKLKCLVFIPIISRTYCDPKSFAWVHEFKAFIEQTSQDQFGLKVKLPGGNVTNRILPIQIHDLDADDKKLVENELCGFLRGIEFIYKEPGVNRPLTQNDDEKKNHNNTKYKNQINKVANAIKEIISGLKSYQPKGKETSKKFVEERSMTHKNLKTRFIAGCFILLVLFIAGYFVVSKLIKPSTQPEKSIAVLPFENWNSDAEYIHLGDAITDEIILQLQTINEFDRVLSRSSTMQFKESRPTIPEIARKLGVNYIIEGSIQRQKDNVIIRVQVIRAKNEDHIWGNKYNGKWVEILNIQNDIAKKVAEGLKVALTPAEIKRIEKKPTENMEAYNQYWLGKYYYYKQDPESCKEAIMHFEKAIKLDSTFALANVYLAYTYQFMVRYNWIKPADCYQQTKDAIFKAIELDDTLGEAYAVLGLFKIVFDWDIYGPDADFRKAIRLSPNSSEVYVMYTQYLRWLGRYDEGIVMAKKAVELDPLNAFNVLWLETIYFYSGRYDQAINYLNQILVIDSSYIWTFIHLAYNYTLKGDFENALKYADISMSKGDTKNNAMWASSLGWVYARSGEKEKAIEILTRFQNSPEASANISMIYFALGEKEKAFDLLYKAVENRNGMMLYMKAFSDSYFKDLKSDPRFIDLLKKIGFKVN
jgi:TolB-like protein